MRYELSKDQCDNNSWRVEAIDQNGVSYTAYFAGAQAEQRATQFMQSKNAFTHLRAA